MAKITRIKASDTPSKHEESEEPTITRKQIEIKDKKSERAKREKLRKKEKAISVTDGEKQDEKKPFILIRPFVYLFRYIHNSWLELRQVRWPDRKTTWKMVLAVIFYSALFMVIISLLDLFFSWLFGLILGNK